MCCDATYGKIPCRITWPIARRSPSARLASKRQQSPLPRHPLPPRPLLPLLHLLPLALQEEQEQGFQEASHSLFHLLTGTSMGLWPRSPGLIHQTSDSSCY